MKKTAITTGFILIFAGACLAANGFKEGNKLYFDGKYQDALSQYQQFIQKNPDYYEGYFNAGNALYRQEQYDGALNMYKKAQEMNPKDPDITYNIGLTEKKLAEKKSQDSSPKTQDKDKQNQQQGQNQKGQQGDGKQSQGSNPKSHEGQKGQQGNKEQGAGNKQLTSGMTADEVQALLNQKQNQEKRLQGYFGKQYQKQDQEPDMFNMSPAEIMRYMQRQMNDPFGEQQPQRGGEVNKKDW